MYVFKNASGISEVDFEFWHHYKSVSIKMQYRDI